MYSVYALTDPRDQTIRYIGMSKNVWRRYAMHLVMVSRMTPEKDAWVKELGHLNLAPLLKILETVETKEEARERETFWIHYYLNLNTSLLNMVNTGKIFPFKRKALSHFVDTTQDARLFTVAEIAKEAGVTPYSVKRWIKEGELTAYRIGGSFRIAPSHYEQFTQKRKQRTVQSEES